MSGELSGHSNKFFSLPHLSNMCSEKAHSLAHLFTQWGFWMATVFQAFVYSLWEKKCLTKWTKTHALMELNNNLEWFPKHLRRHVTRDAHIIGYFYAMHSVRCFKSICPLIFIDSVVKQLYQGSTIYRYLYTWGNGSSKKSRDLPKVSLLVNHRTRTQTQAGWLQNALCYTWDGAVVPECEMSPKW